jgi:PAS domain S-box-containing protein
VTDRPGVAPFVAAFAFAGVGQVVDLELRAFFEGVPLAELVLDAQGTVQASNVAARQLFSTDARELRGVSFHVLFQTSSHPAIQAAFGVLVNPTAPPQRFAADGRLLDGRAFPAEVTVLRLSPASPTSYGAIVRDLREARAGPTPTDAGRGPGYSLPELLMANRLRELV